MADLLLLYLMGILQRVELYDEKRQTIQNHRLQPRRNHKEMKGLLKYNSFIIAIAGFAMCFVNFSVWLFVGYSMDILLPAWVSYTEAGFLGKLLFIMYWLLLCLEVVLVLLTIFFLLQTTQEFEQ